MDIGSQSGTEMFASAAASSWYWPGFTAPNGIPRPRPWLRVKHHVSDLGLVSGRCRLCDRSHWISNICINDDTTPDDEPRNIAVC